MGFAANSQSINDYRRTHQNLLAKQNNIKDKIKVEEAQKYARDLYGDKETAGNADIYSEGWNSGTREPLPRRQHSLYQDNRRIKICNASKA